MPMKILVVDDSDTIRQSLKYALEKGGYQVSVANNGLEAMKTLDIQGRFNLVITDLNMDGMNGMDLIRKIRASASNKFTPILMLTTESGPAKIAEAKQAGANGWITKPFNPTQILALAEKLIK